MLINDGTSHNSEEPSQLGDLLASTPFPSTTEVSDLLRENPPVDERVHRPFERKSIREDSRDFYLRLNTDHDPRLRTLFFRLKPSRRIYNWLEHIFISQACLEASRLKICVGILVWGLESEFVFLGLGWTDETDGCWVRAIEGRVGSLARGVACWVGLGWVGSWSVEL
jgi:hypothetical protein